jgi:hypothetical protein
MIVIEARYSEMEIGRIGKVKNIIGYCQILVILINVCSSYFLWLPVSLFCLQEKLVTALSNAGLAAALYSLCFSFNCSIMIIANQIFLHTKYYFFFGYLRGGVGELLSVLLHSTR